MELHILKVAGNTALAWPGACAVSAPVCLGCNSTPSEYRLSDTGHSFRRNSELVIFIICSISC